MSLIDEVLEELSMAGFKVQVIELIAPVKIPDPNQAGRQIDDWTNPTVAAVSRGAVQPASYRALERAGMLGRVNIKQIHCQPMPATPEGRIRIEGTVYIVRSVSPWDGPDNGHTEMLVEVL